MKPHHQSLRSRATSIPPFSIRVLQRDENEQPPTNDQLLVLLPASYRTQLNNLVAADQQVKACIEHELDLQRLNKIFNFLWIAGRPMPPRPLHHQVLLSREIFITEKMDMHLVWTGGRIFLKPIPRFLLEPGFWISYLSCANICRCPKENVNAQTTIQDCNQTLWRSALGFLFSYAALITHESDFIIAKEKHLLPEELQWLTWRALVGELITNRIYSNIDARFIYGELRLSRLNKVYRLSQGSFLRGYMTRWQQYKTFFEENLSLLASATVYIAIVLTAMQVGLATESLAHNSAFQAASYRFSIFSILGPLAAIGLLLVAFFCIFVINLVRTVAYKRERFLNIEPEFHKP